MSNIFIRAHIYRAARTVLVFSRISTTLKLRIPDWLQPRLLSDCTICKNISQKLWNHYKCNFWKFAVGQSSSPRVDPYMTWLTVSWFVGKSSGYLLCYIFIYVARKMLMNTDCPHTYWSAPFVTIIYDIVRSSAVVNKCIHIRRVCHDHVCIFITYC